MCASSATTWPVWCKREFEILIGNYLATDDELLAELPQRAVGAIRTVREFICAYHKGQNHSGLSDMMVKRLQASGKLLTCANCRTVF